MTTTFTGLQALPDSEKIFLLELQPAQNITSWTITPAQSNTYDVDYLFETITLSDGTTRDIRKSITDTEEDKVALTVQNSIANVESNAGSYWHDTANEKLYVHPTGTDDPNDHVIMGFFWMYFSTEGVDIDGKYYEPYIDSLPDVSQSNPNLYWGISPIGGGGIRFANNTGYFDQISTLFIWTDKKAILLFGGESLPYSEYQAIYTGRVNNKNYTRNSFSLDIKSSTFGLLRTIPINKYWSSNFPNLEKAAEGRPIPIAYGSYSEFQAPLVTLINDDYGVNTYQFQICDHAINSITDVYVNYGDGVGWQSIAHGNEDLANAKFTIVSASYVPGTSKIKVSFEGKHNGGTIIEGAPEVVADILTDILGFSVGDLNAASFTQSEIDSDVQLNVFIESETSCNTIISKIAGSDLGFFDEDEEGLFRYRTWSPIIPVGIPSINDTDILGVPTIREDSNQLYYQIKIGYSYDLSNGAYIHVTETDNDSYYIYGKKERLPIDTYLRDSSDATILAQRLLLLVKTPTSLVSINLKLPMVDKLLGDKFKLTMSRAMFSDSGGYDERVFEINNRSIRAYQVENQIEAFDLKGFGGQIGFWTDAAAPVWGSSTESDKATDGYWLDSNGYADPADDTSLNVSRWW